MDSAKIISKFELYVDDGTELSATDELELLNKKYQEVCSTMPWEFLKKEFGANNTGIIAGLPVALPDDFQYIQETEFNGVVGKFVFVGDRCFKVVNFSDKHKYQGNNYCWVDIVNGKLVFNETENLIGKNLTYDYIYMPKDLEIDDEPVFPSRFHPILYHLMASDDYAIQQFDKAKSYANENEAKAEKLLEQMKIWNANLIV